jgi:phosphohistidine swiveling domain-containing protein
MLISNKKEFSAKSWKRINMRNVNNLLGVEFIHNLYNRHLPRINSIRFRNTITIWKDGVVNSYAPQTEWDYLANWLGKKFFNLDKKLLIEISNLLNFDRTFFNDFVNYLKKLKLEKISNENLGLTLIDLQDYVLGELYQVNLVQIEHALTSCIKKILNAKTKNADNIFSKLICSNELTEAQKEEIKFNKIIDIGRKNKCRHPKRNKHIFSLIKNHFELYSHMSCAYGELPYKIEFYINKYTKKYDSEIPKEEEYISIIKTKYAESLKLIKKLNNKKLETLIPLMINVGIFRDYNKAQLGQTIQYRLKILDIISKRGLEKRHNLNYYLLSEILSLLEDHKLLNKKVIERRKHHGIKLIRSEYLELNLDHHQEDQKGQQKILSGVCASQGLVKGKCKIIINKEDAKKLKTGDIMVAVGTDFDLIDAMQKSAAVITEEGGLLSHASVVCREMSKPCCIGVKDATIKLKDGYNITLDASNGIIKIDSKI